MVDRDLAQRPTQQPIARHGANSNPKRERLGNMQTEALVTRAFFVAFRLVCFFPTLASKGGTMSESWRRLKSALAAHANEGQDNIYQIESERQGLVDQTLREFEQYRADLHELTPAARHLCQSVILPFWEEFTSDPAVVRYTRLAPRKLLGRETITIVKSSPFFWPKASIEEFGKRAGSDDKVFHDAAQFRVESPGLFGSSIAAQAPNRNLWETSLLWLPGKKQKLINRTIREGGPHGLAAAYRAKANEKLVSVDSVDSLLVQLHPSVLIDWADNIQSGAIYDLIGSQIN